jgi:hypothetical protein
MRDEKIEGAIRIIRENINCDEQTALYIAQRLWRFYCDHEMPLDLKPGEVAQRFRERISYHISDVTQLFETEDLLNE